MFLFLFFLFALLGAADTPGLQNALLSFQEELLERLDRIAGPVQPPLPVFLMGAGFLFGFIQIFGRHLAAGWSKLVAKCTAATQRQSLWAAPAQLVVWLDAFLAVFKPEDNAACLSAQALERRLRVQRELIEGLETTNGALETRINNLEARLQAMASSPTAPST